MGKLAAVEDPLLRSFKARSSKRAYYVSHPREKRPHTECVRICERSQPLVTQTPLSLHLGASELMHSESSLARLHKKAVPQKGPCPSTRRASSSTCSLVDTESSRSWRSSQRTRLVMYHRDLREITRVKAPYQ